jgi:hypothetical protein
VNISFVSEAHCFQKSDKRDKGLGNILERATGKVRRRWRGNIQADIRRVSDLRFSQQGV